MKKNRKRRHPTDWGNLAVYILYAVNAAMVFFTAGLILLLKRFLT